MSKNNNKVKWEHKDINGVRPPYTIIDELLGDEAIINNFRYTDEDKAKIEKWFDSDLVTKNIPIMSCCYVSTPNGLQLMSVSIDGFERKQNDFKDNK